MPMSFEVIFHHPFRVWEIQCVTVNIAFQTAVINSYFHNRIILVNLEECCHHSRKLTILHVADIIFAVLYKIVLYQMVVPVIWIFFCHLV